MSIEEIAAFLEQRKEELKKDRSLEYLLELQSDLSIVKSELIKIHELPLETEKNQFLKVANNLFTLLVTIVHTKKLHLIEEITANINSKPPALRKKLENQLKDQLDEALEFQNFIEALLLKNQ
jgi:hypothetical protein